MVFTKLRHAGALRAAHRSRQRQQADLPSKGPGLFGGIGRAVITQPLRWGRRQLATEAFLDGFQRHVAEIVATVAIWAGHPTYGLAVAAARAKVTRSFSPSSQRKSKPSEHQRVLLVSTATPFVTPRHAWLFAPAFQQRIVLMHDAVNTLHIDWRQDLLLVLPTQ